MVKQTRIVFTLGDLLTIRLRCRECGGEVSQHLDNGHLMPERCPLCEGWWGATGSANAIQRALEAIRRLRRNGELPVELLLEIDGDDG